MGSDSVNDIRRYGCYRDLADHRDAYLRLPAQLPVLPDHVDRLGYSVPRENQLSTSSCTGHGVARTVNIITGATRRPFSRIFPYWNGRDIESDAWEDAGAQIRDVVKSVAKRGICFESYWPFVPSRINMRPSDAAYKAAREMIPRIANYERILDFVHLKYALALGLPVVMGFTVFESFESDAVANSGWVPYPKVFESRLGGHCVVAEGYDVRPSAMPAPFVWAGNSYGSGFGLEGYIKFPLDWFMEFFSSPTSLISDCWAIHPRIAGAT